jgi:hypothetical protein
MRSYYACAALSALLTMAVPERAAEAQTLPSWNISAICARESAPGQCGAFEGRALRAVSASWPFVLESVKKTCLSQLNSQLDHSWRLLADCIDIETLKVVDKQAVHTAKTPAEPVPPPKPPAAAEPTTGQPAREQATSAQTGQPTEPPKSQ